MIPVFHTALYSRSRRDLGAVVAGVGLFYLLPILIVGPPSYPHSQYRSAVLTVAVSAIIGFATQLVAIASAGRPTRPASGSRCSSSSSANVVHRLFEQFPHPRIDVCQAAEVDLQRGDRAALRASAADGDGLVCTAVTELEGRDAAQARRRRQRSPGRPSTQRRPVLVVPPDVEARVVATARLMDRHRPPALGALSAPDPATASPWACWWWPGPTRSRPAQSAAPRSPSSCWPTKGSGGHRPRRRAGQPGRRGPDRPAHRPAQPPRLGTPRSKRLHRRGHGELVIAA